MLLSGGVLSVLLPLMSVTALADGGGAAAAIEKINGSINSAVWSCMLFAILGVGLLMTVIIGGFQFRRFGHWWKNSIGSIFSRRDVRKTDDEKSISQFQSLCAALSAAVGTGREVQIVFPITDTVRPLKKDVDAPPRTGDGIVGIKSRLFVIGIQTTSEKII